MKNGLWSREPADVLMFVQLLAGAGCFRRVALLLCV